MHAELWTFGKDAPTRDLEGFEVHARDGSIGKIDEATEEMGSSAVVVDTGPWIFGRKVVIPAGALEQIDLNERSVTVALTMEQIKNSPEFDPTTGWPNEEHRTSLEAYYGSGDMRAAS